MMANDRRGVVRIYQISSSGWLLWSVEKPKNTKLDVRRQSRSPNIRIAVAEAKKTNCALDGRIWARHASTARRSKGTKPSMAIVSPLGPKLMPSKGVVLETAQTIVRAAERPASSQTRKQYSR